MIRIAAFAAALAFAASSANAAEIRVSLAGKSADQVRADLLSASRTVCYRETSFSPLAAGSYGRCVRETLKAAQAQLRA